MRKTENLSKGINLTKEVYWHKGRHINQWKRTENLEFNPDVYGQMIFGMGPTITQLGERNGLFNQ